MSVPVIAEVVNSKGCAFIISTKKSTFVRSAPTLMVTVELEVVQLDIEE